MNWKRSFNYYISLTVLICLVPTISAQEAGTAENPIRLKANQTVKLFQNENSPEIKTWLQTSGFEDKKNEYTIKDGQLHIAGTGMGYVGIKDHYADYHLSLEYKWGEGVDGSKYVRNSGLLLHGVGKDGSSRGIWLTSIEVQLAQGCEGDIIVIRGKDHEGKTIPATVTSNTIKASDGKTRWNKDGTPTKYTGRQFWWSLHEPGFKELRDTRGKDDVASPLGEWTKIDCICKDDRITVKVNGVTVNEIYDVFPSAGQIHFENEKNEIYFRNVTITGLTKQGAENESK